MKKERISGPFPKVCGHANPTITQNIYVHWQDEEIHQAALDVGVCAQKLQKVQNPESDL
jgi:hypothetical protein